MAFEKVNPYHPDKVADRIAGALVDYAYGLERDPKIAVEVLIGHGYCNIIAETSVKIDPVWVSRTVDRIAGNNLIETVYREYEQDKKLAMNQREGLRCGDNGIFKGVPVTREQQELTDFVGCMAKMRPQDGKYILDGKKMVICQSGLNEDDVLTLYDAFYGTAQEPEPHKVGRHDLVINPLGKWTGGIYVDSGATNRKLGSDMGDSVTGGGLCLSGDSEFLAEDKKWHKIADYSGQKVAQWGKDGRLEFVKPEAYIHNRPETLYHIYNKSKLSMCVTPYHEVLLKTSKGNLTKKSAQAVVDKLRTKKGNQGFIIHDFWYKNESSSTKYANESLKRLQVAFCADGTFLGGTNKTWNGRVRVKKQKKIDRMRELLGRAGIAYKETKDNEYSIFWFTPAVQSKSLYECFIGEEWDVLYDEIFRWDGDEQRRLFSTTHKEDADFVQLVIASRGKCATINKCDRIGRQKGKSVCASIEYIVSELKSAQTALKQTKSDIFVDEVIGESYCFNVPSHNLIIRHNDRIFITGNCGKDLSKADVSLNIYCWLKAQEWGRTVEQTCAIGDAEIEGVPYSEIVEMARNYIERLGGFEKFAEWGLIRPDKYGEWRLDRPVEV